MAKGKRNEPHDQSSCLGCRKKNERYSPTKLTVEANLVNLSSLALCTSSSTLSNPSFRLTTHDASESANPVVRL
jgi:hypothetical protein